MTQEGGGLVLVTGLRSLVGDPSGPQSPCSLVRAWVSVMSKVIPALIGNPFLVRGVPGSLVTVLLLPAELWAPSSHSAHTPHCQRRPRTLTLLAGGASAGLAGAGASAAAGAACQEGKGQQ